MKFESLLLPAFAIAVYACGSRNASADAAAAAQTDSLAVIDEAATDYESWESLADGSSYSGWHKYGGGPTGAAWKVTPAGEFMLDASIKDDNGIVGGGDIVTDEAFEDYELELEWKISPCGNSGIIYNVVEEQGLDYPWLTGPEMQVLDNSCHPDAKIYKHKAGDLYDLIAGDSTVVKPAGEWNVARLVNQSGHVEHWLNGVKLVEYDNTGDGWRKQIANSKFKDMPRFGKSTAGHIALQDHGDAVWYRNIRIREL